MKKDFDDDNQSYTNMNVEGMPFYEKEENFKNHKGIKKIKVNKKERWAMVRAAYLAMLPRLLVTFACFGFVAFLLWLWLK